MRVPLSFGEEADEAVVTFEDSAGIELDLDEFFIIGNVCGRVAIIPVLLLNGWVIREELKAFGALIRSFCNIEL